MNKIAEIKLLSYWRQQGRCYYCQQPMWLSDPADFASKHRVPLGQALQLQATAEHLLPRSDGGPDRADNIVAACVYCNGHRHRARPALSPAEYGTRVRRRLASGRWHALLLHEPSARPGG